MTVATGIESGIYTWSKAKREEVAERSELGLNRDKRIKSNGGQILRLDRSNYSALDLM